MDTESIEKNEKLDNSDILKGIHEITKAFEKTPDKKGFILMPDVKGFKVYEFKEEDLEAAIISIGIREKNRENFKS